MPRPDRPRGAFRLPRRTLRIRLALLYATLFCASAVALAAAAVIFRPDFLMRTSSAAAPGTPCPKCGQPVAAGVKFCPNCGASMAPPAGPQPAGPRSIGPAVELAGRCAA